MNFEMKMGRGKHVVNKKGMHSAFDYGLHAGCWSCDLWVLLCLMYLIVFVASQNSAILRGRKYSFTTEEPWKRPTRTDALWWSEARGHGCDRYIRTRKRTHWH